MAERRSGNEYAPTPLPFDVLEGDVVEQSLRRNKKGLTLQKGTRVLLLVSENNETKNLNAITLQKDFRGYFTKIEDEPYHGLSGDAVRINVIPDSDERRAKVALYRMRVRDAELGIGDIDQQLAREFLADKQDVLDPYYIDPENAQRVTLQVAVDRTIQTSF